MINLGDKTILLWECFSFLGILEMVKSNSDVQGTTEKKPQ